MTLYTEAQHRASERRAAAERSRFIREMVREIHRQVRENFMAWKRYSEPKHRR